MSSFIYPGNGFAMLVMLVWPMITYVIFRKTSAASAIILSLLLAKLLLPVRTTIFLPGLPDLDKDALAALSTFTCALFFSRRTGSFFPKTGVFRLLIAAMAFSPVFTVLNNADPQINPYTYRPGLGFAELKTMMAHSVFTLLPFILGYQFLFKESVHRKLVIILVASGALYSLLIMYEIRMSPQLHNWVYGLFPHDWRQQVRAGGFRAVVFLGHGLLVSAFLMAAVTAAAYLWRKNIRIKGISPLFFLLFLLAVLVLNKSWAALILGVGAVALVKFWRPRFQLKISVIVVALCLMYPALRTAGYIPTESLTGLALEYSEDRAQSLQFRFINEQKLLEQANQKPVFGWGIWSRQKPLLEGEYDTPAVTDGWWTIIYGTRGWVGYITHFGLIGLPIFFLFRASVRTGKVPESSIVLSVIVSIVMLDQLPNASMTPLIWLISGALLGLVEKDLSGDGSSKFGVNV